MSKKCHGIHCRENCIIALSWSSILATTLLPKLSTMNSDPVLLLLEENIERWNQWRADYPNVPCSLEGEYLSGGYFFGGNFSGVNLRKADLRRACLIGADFRWADLRGADLRGAYLDEANFYGANLNDADFSGTSLNRADLRRVHWLGKQVTCADAEQLCDRSSIVAV